LALALPLAIVGCGATDDGTGGASTGTDGAGGSGGAGGGATSTVGPSGTGGAGGAGPDCAAKSDACASTFGALFTKSNGRADGTLLALVQTTDTQCALFNSDHVVLELTMLGQVQRLVVSVDGVAVTTTQAPLVGPPFAEGWHPDVALEYPTDLGLHSPEFTSVTIAEAEGFLCSHLELGEPVSVYAYSDGSSPSSAHQIHSNDNYPDGAIVVGPTTATPLYLAFRYETQVF
jgi:hypothetical protein